MDATQDAAAATVKHEAYSAMQSDPNQAWTKSTCSVAVEVTSVEREDLGKDQEGRNSVAADLRIAEAAVSAVATADL